MRKPRTTWNGGANRKIKDGPIWAVCAKCGEERLTFAPEEGVEHYVCSSCRQKDEESVSMRCSRHRKRFNVPKSWIDKCWWLCPRCYEKLSKDERYKYMPMKMSATHEAEDGKPIIRPSTAIKESGKDEAKSIESGVGESTNEAIALPKEKAAPLLEVEEPVERGMPAIERRRKERREHYIASRISDNPALAALLPRFKIACMKCGEVVPCHYSWFDNSTVLCPSCYGKMTDYEIRLFHQSHQAEKPMCIPNSLPVQKVAPVKPADFTPCNVPSITKTKWTKDSHLVNSGGVWSNSRITGSSRDELIEACRCGKVSKARCRIELRRRANASFYNMFPPEVEAAPIPVL